MDVAAQNTQFEVFFDGDCPMCRREIEMLRWLDKRDRVTFTDISEAGFDATPLGTSWEALMAEIHGRTGDGRWVKGVEVFRQLYSAVGFSWLVPVTRIPGISHLLDAGYVVFAKNRLRLTGRCSEGTCRAPVGP